MVGTRKLTREEAFEKLREVRRPLLFTRANSKALDARLEQARVWQTFIAMSERLVRILAWWRERAVVSEWVFASPRDPSRPLYEQVRDDRRGVVSPHHLRHTMRTRLAEVGATPDLARIALGHSLGQDVSQRYLTPQLLVEAVRPLMNAVAERYAQVLRWDSDGSTEDGFGGEDPAGGSSGAGGAA